MSRLRGRSAASSGGGRSPVPDPRERISVPASAAEGNRVLLGPRYLYGQPALFSDAASDWGALREQAEGLAGLGGSLAGSPHETPRRRGRPELDLDALHAAARSQAPAEAVYLADLARAAALDLLGDGEGAAAIVERQLRTSEG